MPTGLNHAIGILVLSTATALSAGPAAADAWQPTRNVEFIVPSGTGGGADQMARMIQGIIQKNHLMDRSLVVINKSDLTARWNSANLDVPHLDALHGTNVERLQQAVRSRFIATTANEPRWWTPRQREVLSRALVDPEALEDLSPIRKSQIANRK